ncbi:MAG: hypothetical protein GF311_27605 [Candidatus Lokiarchaeota archaeon]|nr:hypothetical protein [Candidatus Lokiarchaeota archaeon]
MITVVVAETRAYSLREVKEISGRLQSLVSSSSAEAYLKDFRQWLQDQGFVENSSSEIETWDGSVWVEWLDSDTGKYEEADHRVSIVLPSSFPYHAPIVISLDDPPLDRSWHLAPEPLYSLCLWNTERGWQPHFSAQRLISRIREWFINYHTDDWPENSQVPDLHRYLHKIGVFVIGEDWQPSCEANGRFTLWMPTTVESLPHFASTYPLGFSAAKQVKPEARLADPMHFRSDAYQRQIGVWFRVDEPFVPPRTLRDLLKRISDASHQSSGYAANVCKHTYGTKTESSVLHLAVGYTDVQDKVRWLFLRATLPEDNKRRRKLYWSNDDYLDQVKVKSYQTAPAGKRDLLRRSAFMSKELRTYRVIIFGIGALGSSVAMLLAKAGIGTLGLVDDDVVMPGNAMRHICGVNLTGFQKTLATSVLIKKHAPDCTTRNYTKTWDRSKLMGYLADFDLVIDATASHNFSLLLNEICIELSKPMIFVAAYRRAAVGRIIVHRHAADPCLACYEIGDAWNEESYPLIPPDPDGTFIEDGCGSVTEEAVALDVEAIANLAARTAVKVCQAKLGKSNVAIFVNEPVESVSKLLKSPGLHWFANEALPHCLVCQE